MKRMFLMVILIAGSCLGRADTRGIDDAKLREILTTTFLDLHPVKRDVEVTLADLNYASNRLVSAAKDVYFETTERRSKQRAMSVVSSYGTPDDVDFIVSCATNHECWESAAIGVLKLCGVTTNSISRIDGLMNCEVATNGVHDLESSKSYVIRAMLNRGLRADVSLADKKAAWEYSISFASNHVDTIMVTDMALSRFDGTFRNSQRRLALLRYLQPLETIPDLQHYVSEEINKLEALPAAQLTE